MKKLALYAMIASCIITTIYVIKIQWFVETDLQFWGTTFNTALCEFGLWCFYYYSRDYAIIKEQEERIKYFEQNLKPMSDISDKD